MTKGSIELLFAAPNEREFSKIPGVDVNESWDRRIR